MQVRSGTIDKEKSSYVEPTSIPTLLQKLRASQATSLQSSLCGKCNCHNDVWIFESNTYKMVLKKI